MGPRAIVRFESRTTPGKWFTGRVRFVHADRAIVDDINDRWKGHVVTVSRLEYVRPTGKFR